MYFKEYLAYFMFSCDMGPTQQLNQTEPSNLTSRFRNI